MPPFTKTTPAELPKKQYEKRTKKDKKGTKEKKKTRLQQQQWHVRL
jgi:hypothetical protein